MAQIAMNILPVTALLANYPTRVTIHQHIRGGAANGFNPNCPVLSLMAWL
jgi:hypothetical protein